MTRAAPAAVETLDLLLAEEALRARPAGEELFARKRRRDLFWIRGLLGCRGLAATDDDVRAVLQGRAGRFLPGQRPYRWIRGLAAAIARIDAEASGGRRPRADDLPRLHAQLEHGGSAAQGSPWRRGAPWDAAAGARPPAAELLPDLLAEISPAAGYGEGPAFFALHPVVQAARLCRILLHLAPFSDLNLLVASLAAAWHLAADGYPPFMPQAPDRPMLVVGGDAEERGFAAWFAEVVLVGHRAIARAARPDPWD